MNWALLMKVYEALLPECESIERLEEVFAEIKTYLKRHPNLEKQVHFTELYFKQRKALGREVKVKTLEACTSLDDLRECYTYFIKENKKLPSHQQDKELEKFLTPIKDKLKQELSNETV